MADPGGPAVHDHALRRGTRRGHGPRGLEALDHLTAMPHEEWLILAAQRRQRWEARERAHS
jgi:hypothetical protein